jgi:hypothetical protein
MKIEYKVENFELYTIDKWYNILKNIEIVNLNGETYEFIKSSIFIEFSKLEILYYIRHKRFSNRLRQDINNKLDFNKSYFFKLSNRSPKDVLENNSELKINDDEHRTIKLEKKIKQLNILQIKSIDDIENLLKLSSRCKEDIKLFSKYNGKTKLYLVFQDWLPNLGKSTEYRCFINSSKLVGVSLFKPEYYSSRTVIPIEIIKNFTDKIIDTLKHINLKKYIIDCYINNNDNDKYKVYLIEINPFDEYTDTFSFDYDIINNSDSLLVTI